jgi:gliding motility-associated-like protein
MKTQICFLLLLGASLLDVSSTWAQRTCGMDSVRTQAMGMPQQWQAHQERMDAMRIQLQADAARSECDNVLLIPVAAHFQNTGIPLNCAIDMALSQVDAMNADFAATNADIAEWVDLQPGLWPSISNGESCIQFCLATLNHPAGFGLAEGDYAVTVDQTTGDFDAAWSGYLNFFVRTIGGGTLGYSPLGGQGNGDGVTVDPAYFGTVSCGGNTVSPPYHLGRTMTHEVGHYLSLDHPWGFGGCASTDGIADTPVTDNAQFGCPSGQSIVNCTEPILWPTYMEYCDDACLFMFSAGQVAQMDAYASANLQGMLTNSATACQEAVCLGFDVNVAVSHETCSGDNGSVTATPLGGTGPYTFSMPGATSISAGQWNGLDAGNYTLTVEDANECPFQQDLTLVREPAQLELSSAQDEYCSDATGRIEVIDFEPSPLEFSLDGVAWQSSGVFEGLSGGDYVVEVRNDNGCEGSLSVSLENVSDLMVQLASVGVSCDWVDNGQVVVKAFGAAPPVSFVLNAGEQAELSDSYTQTFGSLPTGTHEVRVLDAEGCAFEGEVEVDLDYSLAADNCPCMVFLPNAFTPDRDGRNEAFGLESNCPLTSVRLEVFDRWGRLVFETRDPEKKWNGTGMGSVGQGMYYVPADVYMYRLAYRWGVDGNQGIEPQFETGTVTVIR